MGEGVRDGSEPSLKIAFYLILTFELNVLIYTCVYIYTYIYTNIHLCTSVYMYTYRYIYRIKSKQICKEMELNKPIFISNW